MTDSSRLRPLPLLGGFAWIALTLFAQPASAQEDVAPSSAKAKEPDTETESDPPQKCSSQQLNVAGGRSPTETQSCGDEPDSEDTAPENEEAQTENEEAQTENEEAQTENESKPKKRPFWKRNALLRYLDNVFGMPKNPAEPRFMAYPVIGFSPETSWEFGLSGLYVYYAKDNPKNRLSEIKAFGFVTLEQQYGLVLEHALYSDRDNWFFLGESRFQSFPLFYYGIGSRTDADHDAVVDEVSLVIRERVLRKIVPSLYIGPEFSFDLLSDVNFNWADGVTPNAPRGSTGSFNMLGGAGIVYDTRHNVLNVRHGLFSELAFLHSNSAWGSDYTFSKVQSDTRAYIPVNSRDTLAYQLYGNFTFGEVPFNELATLGGESLMRGYYLGRFRDNHFVGTQLEYRFLPFPFKGKFARRFGAAAFVGTGAVFPGPSLPAIEDFKVAGGAGLRFLLFPDKDIYTRADLAFTEEGPGFYLFIGEAF